MRMSRWLLMLLLIPLPAQTRAQIHQGGLSVGAARGLDLLWPQMAGLPGLEAAWLNPITGDLGTRGATTDFRAKEDRPMVATTDRDSVTDSVLTAVARFNEAINRHDLDGVMDAMTHDCVFENTSPFPDGTRYEGQKAVREFWAKFFQNSPTAHFETEEVIASGDRCVVRWVYTKIKDGKPWHLRGVDLFRVKNGKVSEKLSYVKG